MLKKQKTKSKIDFTSYAFMTYISSETNRKIRVYHKLNARLDLEDLYAKLRLNFPEQDS